MPRIYLPVEGLTLHSNWSLGTVTLHGRKEGQLRLKAWRDQALDRAERPLLTSAEVVLESLSEGTIASVEVPGGADDRESRKVALDTAIDVLTDALDLLRVFQYERSMFRTTMFGLPGDLYRSHLRYLAQEGDRPPWVGFRNDGEVLGTVFDDSVKTEFFDTAFSRLAVLVGADQLEAGPRRAQLAIRLLSQAIRDHRPPMRTLGTVMAVEALLGRHQTLGLAQRVVALTCGPPTDAVCGRREPACAYLAADLTSKRELDIIKRLNDAPGGYYCSEWSEFLDRYSARSGVAHGDAATEVTMEDADRDLFWCIKRLLLTALTWLLDHPTDPADALRRDIDQRPVHPEAEKILARRI